jgi:hypothetical protein
MSEESILLLNRKRRQRLIEYGLLIAVQIVLAGLLASYTQPTFAVALGAIAFGAAWNLAGLREQRRTMGTHSSKRLLGDTIESVGLMMCIVVVSIVSRLLDIPRVSVMAHLSVVILAYFCGSFMGEQRWIRSVFTLLSIEAQHNYIANLNRSLIFPYNIAHLKQIFGVERSRLQRSSANHSHAKLAEPPEQNQNSRVSVGAPTAEDTPDKRGTGISTSSVSSVLSPPHSADAGDQSL